MVGRSWSAAGLRWGRWEGDDVMLLFGDFGGGAGGGWFRSVW